MTDKLSLASYTTNGTAVVMGLATWQELSIIAGIIFGAGTFAANIYFKWRDEKRKRELHEKKLETFADNIAGPSQ